MNQFSIKDIEVLTGVKSHTLRIWEQRYGIPLPKRTPTNIRYYDDDDLKMLLNVSMLNKQGHKISHLTKMSKEELEEKALSTALDSTESNVHIDSLITAMFNLDEVAFEKILSNHLIKNGLEHTMINLFFPFLKRIGILWQTGQVNPAFEHYMSNLIRQKIIVAIDSQTASADVDSKKFILFLPENETHEMGLLFANYIIKSRGHKTIYLGQNLPDSAIASINSIVNADYIMSIVTTAFQKCSSQEFADLLSKRFPKQTILLTGIQFTSDKQIKPAKNVSIIESLNDFIKYIDSMTTNRQ